MEISQLETVAKHEAGAEYNVLSPVDGSPTDVFINIMGPDSKAWRQAKKKQTNQLITAKALKKDHDLDFDKMDIDALCSVVIGWRGIVKDGKDYPANKKNVRSLLENSPSIVSQLLSFLGEAENFTKG
jgi:hypothetical protein